MAQQHTSQTIQQPNAQIPQGTPVIMRTETTVPVTPPINPLMSGDNWGPFLTMLGGFAMICAVAARYVTGKLADFKEAHGHVHALIDRRLDEVEHDTKGLRSRQDASEHLRSKDEARFVKLEGEISAFKDVVVRIERNQEKFADEEKAGRKEIIESIRELREVKPRP